MSGSYVRKRPWEEATLDQQHVSKNTKHATARHTKTNYMNDPRDHYTSSAPIPTYQNNTSYPTIASQREEWRPTDNILPPLNLTTQLFSEALKPLDALATPRRTQIWAEQPHSENHSPIGTSQQHTPLRSAFSSSASPASYTPILASNAMDRDDEFRSDNLPRTWSMASMLTTDIDFPSPVSAVSNSVDSSVWKTSLSNSRRLSSAPSTTDENSITGRNNFISDIEGRGRKEEDKDARLRVILEEMMQEKLMRKDAELALLRQECQALKLQAQKHEKASSSALQVQEESNPQTKRYSQQSEVSNKNPPDDVHSKVLGDLQHQISKQSLSLKTLQNEHDNLLSAFSRSQTRSVALQKKCDVATSEMAELLSEKDKLQEYNELLQTQIEDLTKQRDDYRKQAVAGGGQYTSIVQMASRLEMASSSSEKRWRIEKDGFEEQLAAYQCIIASLSSDHDAAKLEITKLQDEVLQARQAAESFDTNMDGGTVATLLTGTTKPTYCDLELQVAQLSKRVKELEELAEKSRSSSREMERMAQQILMHSSGVSEHLEGVLHRPHSES